MTIKVLHSYTSLLLILLVKVLNGEAKDDIKIKFILNNPGACTQDEDGRTDWLTDVGTNLSISVSGKYFINHYECTADGKFITKKNENNNDKKVIPLNDTKHLFTIPKITLEKNMEGLWICFFLSHRDTVLQNTVQVSYEGHNYTRTDCQFNVTYKEDPKSNGTGSDSQSWIYIISGTLLLFTIIILVQACIIIYCKLKALRVTRIQSLALSVRSSSSQEDKKRYSTTPSRRSRISELFGKANQKDETCIYETLEEIHAGLPPTPPIETIPTLKRKPSDLNVRKRPPVPLPKIVSDDDVTNSLRDIQRQTFKQSTPFIEEPKAKPPKIPPPVPISPTKPEPEIRPKPLKHRPEMKGKPTRAPPFIAEPGPELPVTPGMMRSLKSKPGPSIVASELDNIFKQRQQGSQPVPSDAVTLPVRNSSQNKPDQKFGKSGSFTSNINPFSNAGKSKKSLPNIKQHRMINTETETPEVQSNVVTQRPQTQILNRPSPKPAGKIEPPKSGSLKKKPLPPVPAPNPVSQPPVLPIPVESLSQTPPGGVPRPLPDVQESVYEEFEEEEPVYYNSDDEWTYEPLRQYNIYSA